MRSDDRGHRFSATCNLNFRSQIKINVVLRYSQKTIYSGAKVLPSVYLFKRSQIIRSLMLLCVTNTAFTVFFYGVIFSESLSFLEGGKGEMVCGLHVEDHSHSKSQTEHAVQLCEMTLKFFYSNRYLLVQQASTDRIDQCIQPIYAAPIRLVGFADVIYRVML